MTKSYKGLLVIAATVMSFISVQSVCADTVAGEIYEISSTKPIIVTVDVGVTEEVLIDVYGAKIKYLDNQYGIVLSEGEDVSFETELVECRTGEEVLRADSITVGDVTVTLR